MKKVEIKKILIPIDFSDTAMLAIEHVSNLARLLGAELLLIHVQEIHWNPFNIVEPELTLNLPTGFADKIEQKLEEMASNIMRDHSITASVIFTEGNVTKEIVTIAEENNVDLIVMGTHGVSGFEEFFVGSNTYKVVTRSKCPVLSVQGHAKNIGFKHIVLPIDESTHSRQKVQHAALLAKTFNATVHIAGIIMEDEEGIDLARFEIKLDQVEEFLKKQGVTITRKTIKGKNEAVMTLDYAKERNADLIVIMTDQFEHGAFLSPYAQQIVNHSKIPVLSIRPVIGEIEFPSLSGGFHAPVY